MNGNDLFNALNELDDSILEKSEENKNYGKKMNWKKWTAIAASLVIVASVVFGLIHAGVLKKDSAKDGTYFFGTYTKNNSTYTTISCSLVKYIQGDNAANVDVTQFPAHFFQVAE